MEKGDPDSEPVPGWWPQSNVWLSAECTLKDVNCFYFFSLSFLFSSFFLFFLFSLFFLPFFLFALTISLSLLPDCIRIDCSLSKWFYPFFWLNVFVFFMLNLFCVVPPPKFDLKKFKCVYFFWTYLYLLFSIIFFSFLHFIDFSHFVQYSIFAVIFPFSCCWFFYVLICVTGGFIQLFYHNICPVKCFQKAH